MKQVLILALALCSMALQAELKSDLAIILKQISIKKDPVKNLPIRATYLARVFNYDIDRVITITFKNAFAEPYQMVTKGARELSVGEMVRIDTDHPSLVEKIETGKLNEKELLINELFKSSDLAQDTFEKVVGLSKNEILMNCSSPYMSLIVTKGKNYFMNLHLLAKDGDNTVYTQDDLYRVEKIEGENALSLKSIYGRIFLTLKGKNLEGIYFEKSLQIFSLPETLSQAEKNPAQRFVVDNDLLNDGLSCSSFKHKSLIELL